MGSQCQNPESPSCLGLAEYKVSFLLDPEEPRQGLIVARMCAVCTDAARVKSRKIGREMSVTTLPIQI